MSKKFISTTMSRRDIINKMRHGKLNANPIGQRPAIPDKSKPVKIINAMIDEFFTGAIILRDIRKDEKAQEMYPNQEFLVIDGGNRTRAMRAFDDNQIVSKYGKINEIDADKFLNTEETVILFECDATEATQVFRTINSTTVVNDMEMIMSNEDSSVAKFIRTQTQRYPEYKNSIHDLFDWRIKQGTDDLRIPKHFTGQYVNPRREWDELVAVVLVKCLAGMKNVNAGYPIISKLIEEDKVLSDNVKKKVKTTLDSALKVLKFARNKRYSKVTFGVFQLVYFEIMGQGGRIIDFDEFSRLLWSANAKLDRKYDKDGYSIMSKKKAFAKGEEQSLLAKEYIEEMGDLEGVVNFAPRTASYDQQYKELAEKGFKDGDGNNLEMKDAEFLHFTPHSEGGTEGIVERKSLNHIIPTYEEALMLQKLREEKEVEA